MAMKLRALTGALPKARLAACLLAIVLAIFLAYRPVLGSYFVSDDFGFIRIFYTKPLRDFPRLFTQDWSGGLWGAPLDEIRPIIALSYWVDTRLWGLNPTGYHVTNVLFHSMSSLLVFFIARHLAGGQARVGLTAGLLFGLYPIHSEPVSWIAARVDVISMFIYLAAFALFMAYRSTQKIRYWLLSLGTFGLALFSKELALTFPLMVIAYDLFYRFRPAKGGQLVRAGVRQALTYAPFFVLLAVYLLIRRAAFESPLRGEHVTMTALRAFISRQRFYFGELLPPLNPLLDRLPFDAYSSAVQAGVAAVFLLLLVGCGYWLVRSPAPKLSVLRCLVYFGLVWHVIAVLPAFVADIPQSPRYLYLPSAGMSIAVALLVWSLASLDIRRIPNGWASMRGHPAPASTYPARLHRALIEPARLRLLLGGLATAALLVAAALSLQSRNADWVEASRLSKELTAEAGRLVRDAPAGGEVILNVPGAYGRAYLWGWNLPFALQEPFTSSGLYETFEVLEQRDSYRCPPCWFNDREQAIGELLAEPTAVHVLYIDRTVRAARMTLSREELRRRVALALVPGPEPEIEPMYEAFMRLLDSLNSEAPAPGPAGGRQ